MDTANIFANALNLPKPWYVSEVKLVPSRAVSDGTGSEKTDAEGGGVAGAASASASVPHVLSGGTSKLELHITVDFQKGWKFPYPAPEAGEDAECDAYDTELRTWRHLNFFQYRCYIHAYVPRVWSKERSLSPKTLKDLPWARPGSGFTLLFESFVVELAKAMPMSAVAETVGEHDTRLWRVVEHYVGKAREKADYSQVDKLGMDETSKKGHNYLTVFVNLDTRKVVFVTDGKDHTTVDKFAKDFVSHNGDCGKIGVVTCDMSLGFKAGITAHFSNAMTIIDKFHVIKHANEAIDKVRREEVKENDLLKRTRYLWLKNDENLTEKQRKKKEQLMKKHLKTGRACMMREELQEIYETSGTREEAESSLKKLCDWMMRSRLDHMKQVAKMIRAHWEEILNYFDNKYTNAILEGLNNVIQNIKRRARGFRNDKYFTTMIYLVCGEIDLGSVLVCA